jgi:predicted site-specific integrase-resolvase
VSRRYNISTKTVDRWLEDGILPPPILVINRVRYWCEQELDAFDAALVAEQKAKRQGVTREVIPQPTSSNDHAA